jgi:hypothetical protein
MMRKFVGQVTLNLIAISLAERALRVIREQFTGRRPRV